MLSTVSDDIVNNTEDTVTLLNRYIDDLSIDLSKDRLKDQMRSLYVEDTRLRFRMIHFEKVRWKNFLSTGNQFTEIELDRNETTLIIGENGW